MIDDDDLGIALDRVSNLAAKRGVEVHTSAQTELKNYCRHQGVTELPSATLREALVGIGAYAVEVSAQSGLNAVGGGHVRRSLDELCHDMWSECENAATNIVKIGSFDTSEELYAAVTSLFAVGTES